MDSAKYFVWDSLESLGHVEGYRLRYTRLLYPAGKNERKAERLGWKERIALKQDEGADGHAPAQPVAAEARLHKLKRVRKPPSGKSGTERAKGTP